MRSTTVNVSFPRSLLDTMDQVAKHEARSRSELLREAARMYVDRKRRWNSLFSLWNREAQRARLKPQDVEGLIAKARARQHIS